MKLKFPAPLALLVAFVFLLADVHSAAAQSTRYWNRSVAPGKQIEFQWLNSNTNTCKDNGYPKLVVDKKPSLGKFRTVRRKFVQQDGKCKGKRFSVLLVYYVAGRKRGVDNTAFTIAGQNNLKINLKVTVK